MTGPMVRDLMPRVIAMCPPKSLPTYGVGFRRLTAAFGDTPIASITTVDLEALRDRVQREVGVQRVASARERGKALRSYDPDAHGRGAAENLVRSARFYFRVAVNDQLISHSPALGVAVPQRSKAPERPLTHEELSDLFYVAAHTGDDPTLDRLLVLFLRHTACRREGCLNLVLNNLDHRQRRVTLSEKNGQTRVLPLAPWLLRELTAFATERGAVARHDPVFRYLDGHPLTKRRFNTLFDRLDGHTNWSDPLDVGAHWLRHTTLSDIAAVAGDRVAEEYAGHVNHERTIYRYAAVSFEDLVDAYRTVFGA